MVVCMRRPYRCDTAFGGRYVRNLYYCCYKKTSGFFIVLMISLSNSIKFAHGEINPVAVKIGLYFNKGDGMLTVKASKKDLITFPKNLLNKLGIRDGQKVDVKIRKGSVVFIKETEDFLALEGALKDADIETPLKEIDKDWKKWNPLKSL